jgi:hypothetical protein
MAGLSVRPAHRPEGPNIIRDPDIIRRAYRDYVALHNERPSQNTLADWINEQVVPISRRAFERTVAAFREQGRLIWPPV